MQPAPPKIGIVTTSDRASRGEYHDQGTPELEAALREMLRTPFDAVARLIPDERALIEEALIELIDEVGCCLVVTTGGTGPARRDVTVEATLAVAHKPMPGFGELMRKVSLEKVPTAILSRQEAAVRYVEPAGGALIVNLPGSIKAIRECLLAVMPAIPYCIELIGGPSLETNEAVVRAFRPKRS
ncbi:MAG: molybdopterin adenylyltransferase [Deltaproteobacteria bacterium RBG_16_71_12]|nr:MAG: molybdopterin adenylyltransferase [Deltaproteobacteria bacterium RBG_16_71_12]